MKSKYVFVLGLTLLLLQGMALAGSACAAGASAGPTVIASDGRITDFDFVAASGTNFYQFDVKKGHSYSIEVRQDYDDALTTNNFTTSIYDVANGASCTTALAVNAAAGSAAAGVRDTSALDPALPLNSFRGSIIATASGTYKVKVANSDVTNGHYVSVSVAETTLYSPNFTENAPFHTFYAFSNTTGGAINGVLTLTTAGAGSASFTQNLAIPANGSKGSDTTSANFPTMPRPAGGAAAFANDGPPSALQGSATTTNFAGFVNPIAFASQREHH